MYLSYFSVQPPVVPLVQLGLGIPVQQPEELLRLLRAHAFSHESQSCRACRTREMVHDGSTQPNRAELDAPCSPSHPGLPLILRADSAISCIRGHIDELFASGRQLPVILEQVARVGAQLLM